MSRRSRYIVFGALTCAAVWLATTAIGVVVHNRRAQHLIQACDDLPLGTTKDAVIQMMPGTPLEDTEPPGGNECQTPGEKASSALRYNAPVLLNSVYVVLAFDESDRLIAKNRRD